MQFLTTINNAKCLEWGINGTQGALFSLLYEINAWAKEEIIDNKVYYFISRNKILDEMPLYYEKTDTIYRHLKVLEEKGIIEYIKAGKKDLIRITEKGKEWNFLKSKKNSEINPSKIKNSEINPTKLGNKSEKNSEINPTNQDTILNQDTNNKYIYKSKEFVKAFESYKKMRKSIKKPMTENSVKRMLKKLEKIDNEETAIKMLNQAEDKCWLDVYEVKEVRSGNSRHKNNYRTANEKHSQTTDRSRDGENWN